MDRVVKCLVCGASTEEGFLLDQGHNALRSQQEWWQGQPVPSFWMGLKKPEERFRVQAMRCTACGFLMAFATEQAKS